MAAEKKSSDAKSSSASKKPLISTITPCYRMQKYLPLFLEWLPKQTWFDKTEIVLDHNEPTPEELKQVKDFQAKYPGRIKHIIVNKVDPIGTSMNRCMKEATGEFLTIWNVDDLRTDDSLEQQAQILLDNKDVGIVYGDYLLVRKFGTTEGKRIEHDKIPEEEAKKGMIIGPFFMFRKSLLEKAGYFDEQLVQGADYDLALRLAFNAKVARTKGLLGYYLDEGRGQSTKPDSKQPLERNVICLRYGVFDRLDNDNMALIGVYDIPYIVMFGKSHPVTDFVPNYKELIKSRYNETYFTGARKVKLEGISTLKKVKHGFLRWYNDSDNLK